MEGTDTIDRYKPAHGFSTLPYRHRVDSPQKQISFMSVSSTESGPDTFNASQDTVDAVPLRIQKMPLFPDDYSKQRQASVENLLANKPTNMSSESKHSGQPQLVGEKIGSYIPSSASGNLDPDPYSYFEMQQQGLMPKSFLDVHKKSVDPNSDCHIPQKNNDKELHMLNSGVEGDTCNVKKGAGGSTSTKNTNNHSTHDNGFQQSGTSSRQMGTTETDLSVNRPQRPVFNQGLQKHEDRAIENQPTAPISTPPTHTRGRDETQKPTGCCQNTCIKLCCALFNWKHIFDRFSMWDCVMTLVSVSIFIFDVVTDLILALKYYSKIEENEAYRFYFGLTLGLVIGPSIVIQMFSFGWVIIDFVSKKKRMEENTKKKQKCEIKDVITLLFSFIIHFFQLAIFYRYAHGIIYGMKSRYYEVQTKICPKREQQKNERIRKHYDHMWRYEVHDISMLRLLESFLESAPQLVLQLYIMLMTKNLNVVAVVSCVGSLLALSTMMVTIQRAIRNSNHKKNQLSIPASIVMFCWRAFTISSRVLAFALFLTIQPLAFLIFIIMHWVAATIWIAVRGTDFCPKKIAEYLFNGICGIIYIFCFFNVHEEKDGRNSRSRWRMLIFYLVVFAENSIFSILWYFFRPGGDTKLPSWKELMSSGILSSSETLQPTPPSLIPTKSAGVIQMGHALLLIVAVHLFYILGLTFMLLYYFALHPKKSSENCCLASETENTTQESATKLVSAPEESFSRNMVVYSSVPCDEQLSVSAGNLLMSSEPLNSRNATNMPSSSNSQHRTGQRENLRHRERGKISREDNESDVEVGPWSMTVFDRDLRTKKLYNRQYSQEKMLEEHGTSESIDEQIEYSPRQTNRFKAVVTPTHNKRTALNSPITAAPGGSRHKDPDFSKSTKDSADVHMPSVIIRPGSQTLKPTNTAPRSATHHGFQSQTLSSSKKVRQRTTPPSSLNTSPVKQSPNKFSQKIPPSVESRDYSASMSCLMETKPHSYAARRRQALGVPPATSFMINKGEIVESMESSV
uniref:uncharacterized protein LOC120345396 n=1 Tax=Styela clava TaxID=7725 RepID=UPI00193A134C|nr:uncharacterized protein LOC120345396 [Styela clava]